MRKILLLLTLCTLFLFVFVSCDEEGDTILSYKLSDNEEYYIVKNINELDERFITIPSEYKGKPVREIAKNAFHDTNIIEVVAEGKITSIGDGAFKNCADLVRVKTSGGVDYIGDSAFEGCVKLQTVQLSDSLTNIGNNAFKGCTNLQLTQLSSSLTNIGNSAFEGCENLQLTQLADSVTEIGSRAFYNCVAITLSALPSKLTEIKDHTFSNCRSINLSSLPSNLKSIGKNAFYGCKITNLDLTNPSLQVDPTAFVRCTIENLTSTLNNFSSIERYEIKNLVLTDGEIITANIFENCYYLESVTLPNTITKIEENGLVNLKKLKTVNITSDTLLLEEDALHSCEIGTLTFLGENINAEHYAVNNCTIQNLIFTNSYAKLSTLAFSCNEIANLDASFSIAANIEDDCTVIGVTLRDFSGSEDLSELSRIENLTIYADSLSGQKMTVSQDLKSFKLYATEILLDYIRINAPITTLEIRADYNTLTGVYFDSEKLEYACVPTNLISYLPEDIKEIEICAGEPSIIPFGAFKDRTQLEKVTLDEGITVIEGFAFKNCIKLKTIIIPSTVIEIENGAFCDCLSLESVYIPATAKNLGYHMFRGCANATVYCEVAFKPSLWNDGWLGDEAKVVWGYTK